MNKKRMAINMVANVIGLMVTFGISFLLTPFIVKNIGSEAFGFVSLANNFVSYGQIATAALNSMASRFVTIKIYENDLEGANRYFSSVVIANIFIAMILVIPSVLIVIFINVIVNVPTKVLLDVRILWSLLFANFLMDIIGNMYSVATFAKNRLDLSARKNIESNLIKVIILIATFIFLKPSVWYIGLATCMASIYFIAANIKYTRILLPEIKYERNNFSIQAVKEIASAGIWNSFTALSRILLEGLDLIIVNIFIGPAEMGTLAIAKTIPGAISSFVSTVQAVFVPNFMEFYAKKNIKGLLKEIETAIKIVSIFSSIPIVFLLVYGEVFYKLWVPTQDAALVHKLSVLTIGVLIVTAPLNPLYSIYTVTNKIKVESISVFIQGALSTILVFFLLIILPENLIRGNGIQLGLYIVAGVSTFWGVIRALTFSPIYAARCLKVPWYTFYKMIFKVYISMAALFGMSILTKLVLCKCNWVSLSVSAIVSSVISLIINIMIILNKEERRKLLKMVKTTKAI